MATSELKITKHITEGLIILYNGSVNSAGVTMSVVPINKQLHIIIGAR